MNVEYINIQGKVKFANNIKSLNPWGKWAITIYPDHKSLEILRELQSKGMKNVMKKDEDGYYMNFTRPFEKEVKFKNGQTKKVGYTPPEVVDAEGKPFNDFIGADSDVTVKLEVYQHKTPSNTFATASRLFAVRIDSLVPYNPKHDMNDTVKDLVEFPKQPTF